MRKETSDEIVRLRRAALLPYSPTPLPCPAPCCFGVHSHQHPAEERRKISAIGADGVANQGHKDG